MFQRITLAVALGIVSRRLRMEAGSPDRKLLESSRSTWSLLRQGATAEMVRSNQILDIL